jgi:hypothetical protein
VKLGNSLGPSSQISQEMKEMKTNVPLTATKLCFGEYVHSKPYS